MLDLLLVYTPDAASGGSDELAFSLTDGVHTSTGRLTFTIDVRKSEGPRMTVNRGLQLAAGTLVEGVYVFVWTVRDLKPFPQVRTGTNSLFFRAWTHMSSW